MEIGIDSFCRKVDAEETSDAEVLAVL